MCSSHVAAGRGSFLPTCIFCWVVSSKKWMNPSFDPNIYLIGLTWTLHTPVSHIYRNQIFSQLITMCSVAPPPPAPCFVLWRMKVEGQRRRKRRRRSSQPWTERDRRRKDWLGMKKEKGRELRHDSLLLFPPASHLFTQRTEVRKRKMVQRRGA